MQIVLHSVAWCELSRLVRRELDRSGASYVEVVAPAGQGGTHGDVVDAGGRRLPVLVVGDTAYAGADAMAIARELVRHDNAAAA